MPPKREKEIWGTKKETAKDQIHQGVIGLTLFCFPPGHHWAVGQQVVTRQPVLEAVPRLWGRVEGTGRDTDFPSLCCPLNQPPSSREASGHNLGTHLTASCSPQDSVLKIPWSDLGSFLLGNVISLWRVPHIYRCRYLSVVWQGGAICHIGDFRYIPLSPTP